MTRNLEQARTVPPEMGRSQVYAKAGEIVTCENGHPICTIGRDIVIGEPWDPTALVDWQQPEPTIGTFPKCAICGEDFYLSGALHFEDGWRRALDRFVARIRQSGD